VQVLATANAKLADGLAQFKRRVAEKVAEKDRQLQQTLKAGGERSAATS